MARINQNFLKLPGGYLFPEIGRRVFGFTDSVLCLTEALQFFEVPFFDS